MNRFQIAFRTDDSPADWTCCAHGAQVDIGMPLLDLNTFEGTHWICGPCLVAAVKRLKSELPKRLAGDISDIRRQLRRG